MAEQQKTHWKTLRDQKYLGEWNFAPGQEMIVKIKKVVSEMSFNVNTQSDQKVMVAYFENVPLGLIVNVTNAKVISSVVGSPLIEDWVDKKIILMVGKTRVRGEIINCIRVKNQKP